MAGIRRLRRPAAAHPRSADLSKRLLAAGKAPLQSTGAWEAKCGAAGT